MELFPAIDLVQKKAVRLFKGDYTQMTVYSDNPLLVAQDFEACGAKNIHMVDLEGAKEGGTPNLSIVEEIAKKTSLFVEVGGGVRSEEVVRRYLDAGVGRVILGTAAVTNPEFLETMVAKFGKQVAVGVDLKDGFVAIRGWTEKSALTCDDFMARLEALGVGTVICTDVSRDGAMRGTNRELYARLSKQYGIDLIASGGVSSLEDIEALKAMGLYGAIIGKAYYTGAIDLRRAIEVTK